MTTHLLTTAIDHRHKRLLRDLAEQTGTTVCILVRKLIEINAQDLQFLLDQARANNPESKFHQVFSAVLRSERLPRRHSDSLSSNVFAPAPAAIVPTSAAIAKE